MTKEKIHLEKLEKWVNYLLKIGAERKLNEQEINSKMDLMKEDMILNGELNAQYITEELILKNRYDPFFHLTGGADRFKKINCPRTIREAKLLGTSFDDYYVEPSDSQLKHTETDKMTEPQNRMETSLIYDPERCDELIYYREHILRNKSPDSEDSDKKIVRVDIKENSINHYLNDDFTGNSHIETIEFHPKEFEKLLEKQVGEDLRFASKYKLNSSAVSYIRRAYMPRDANAYSEEHEKDPLENDVLRVRFYRIPI